MFCKREAGGCGDVYGKPLSTHKRLSTKILMMLNLTCIVTYSGIILHDLVTLP